MGFLKIIKIDDLYRKREDNAYVKGYYQSVLRKIKWIKIKYYRIVRHQDISKYMCHDVVLK